MSGDVSCYSAACMYCPIVRVYRRHVMFFFRYSLSWMWKSDKKLKSPKSVGRGAPPAIVMSHDITISHICIMHRLGGRPTFPTHIGSGWPITTLTHLLVISFYCTNRNELSSCLSSAPVRVFGEGLWPPPPHTHTHTHTHGETAKERRQTNWAINNSKTQ